jgi:hypothetical protein
MATAGQKRFASLDKDEMDEIMENLDAKRQTHTAVKIFREYLTEKNLPLEFEMLSDQRLDDILANFYLEIRNKSGQMYKKSIMKSYRQGSYIIFIRPQNFGVILWYGAVVVVCAHFVSVVLL